MGSHALVSNAASTAGHEGYVNRQEDQQHESSAALAAGSRSSNYPWGAKPGCNMQHALHQRMLRSRRAWTYAGDLPRAAHCIHLTRIMVEMKDEQDKFLLLKSPEFHPCAEHFLLRYSCLRLLCAVKPILRIV
jgi:hypothetical protein